MLFSNSASFSQFGRLNVTEGLKREEKIFSNLSMMRKAFMQTFTLFLCYMFSLLTYLYCIYYTLFVYNTLYVFTR